MTDEIPSGASCLNPIHNEGDFLRECRERWDNLFAVYGGNYPFSELYLQNRLQIAVELQIRRHPNNTKLLACLNTKETVAHSGGASNDISVNARQTSQRNNESVLIEVGEFIKCGERMRLSIVRLYVVNDEIPERFGDGCYIFRSLLKGTYKTPRIIPNRELNLSCYRILDGHSGGKSMIEGRSNIDRRVSGYKGESGIDLLRFELNDCLSRMAVSIDNYAISFSRDVGDCGLEIIDVMFGPTKF